MPNVHADANANAKHASTLMWARPRRPAMLDATDHREVFPFATTLF
jgi:hypothetical protein